ncbi:hypothetical protein AVEN_111037-1 [Araneus ventricosus]|uniref:Uncharacterized protein n=1 Tax=Araneus ventricosus TaxID=182803 RepID=A0A4Y2JXR2_ARAVE|nr:hypothetical protein AVEN_111037-1 [Araneus ventricosus]
MRGEPLWTPAGQFKLSCRHVNMAGRIDAPSKCELRSVILFLQAAGWFVKGDQCSCSLSDFTTTAMRHSDFWSCPHSWQRPPSQCCCNPAASCAI